MKTFISSFAATFALILCGCGISSTVMAAGFAELARPGPGSAMVSGSPGAPTQDLYPVRFIEVNGEQINGPRDTIWLHPGHYRLTVSVLTTNPRGHRQRTTTTKQSSSDIELEVEAGKIYEVFSAAIAERDGGGFKPVVHRVKVKD